VSRFRRSWGLFKSSVRVVVNNRELLLFPIIVTLLMGVIALFFIAPIALWQTGHAYGEAAHWQAVAQRWVAWDADGARCGAPRRSRPAAYE